MSEALFCCSQGFAFILLHVIIGGACLATTLATVLYFEWELVQFVMDTWRRRDKSEKEVDFFDKLD